MIISHTPIRISLVGGSTDIANFYRGYGGEVISTAIDKYISVHITECGETLKLVSTPQTTVKRFLPFGSYSAPFDSRGGAENLPPLPPR